MPQERGKSRTELYILLLLIAFLGFLAANIGLHTERTVEQMPSATAFSEEDALERLSSSKLFIAGALATMIISFLLLTVAGVAKLTGRSPVPQSPRNEVTWNIWAIVKSIVIILFLYIVALWVTYFLGRSFPFIWQNLTIRVLMDAALKVLICIWIYIMLRRDYGARLSGMGIRSRGIGKTLLFSFVGYISILCVIFAAVVAWSLLGDHLGMVKKANPLVMLLLTERSRLAVLTVLLTVIVLTPLTEEFYFRVLNFCALRKSFGFWPGACISSLYFALIHLDFYTLVPIFVLGIFLAYIYEKTQNFFSVIFVHALHNGIVVFLILSARQGMQ